MIRIYDDWKSGRINIKNSFYSYCRKALGREIEDAIKEDRRVSLADPGDVEKTPDELDVVAIASLNLDKARLEKAIQQLPVVERRHVDDLIDRDEKPRDMAKRLGVPVRDVYMLQKSVVRRLRHLLSCIPVGPSGPGVAKNFYADLVKKRPMSLLVYIESKFSKHPKQTHQNEHLSIAYNKDGLDALSRKPSCWASNAVIGGRVAPLQQTFYKTENKPIRKRTSAYVPRRVFDHVKEPQ